MRGDSGQRERTTDLGIVRINNDAIATIASIAATEIKGVHRMGGFFTKTICDLFRKKAQTKGVKIKMENSDVKLVISIVVEYGVNIPGVADEVQENVKRSVEKMTGLVLSEVDVVVEGVHSPSAAARGGALKRCNGNGGGI